MVYLKHNIKAEPLIWGWYAWPHLIAPATAACNIVERHLKIMQSYIQNPKIHAHAVTDPKMLGGPFVDLGGEKVDEVKQLIEETKQNCAKLIDLCHAIKTLDKMLLHEGKGDSLEALYNRIPQMLKGMVELVYDINSHPSIRLIEPFLYNNYYDNSYQEIVLAEVKTDFRKFVFSTPRIKYDDEVSLRIPFSDQRLDLLFRTKNEPCDIKQISELLGVTETQQALFKTFFTITPHKKKQDNNYLDQGVRVRYFGHACVLVQTQSTSILIDPVISYSTNEGIARYTFEDLPDVIDYIVITHAHLDHIMFETLLQLRHKIRHVIIPGNLKGTLADPSLKLVLKHIGFQSVMELSEGEEISFSDGAINGIPFFGEHCDLNIQSKLSYHVVMKGKSFMFAADSNNLDEFLYDQVFKSTGAIDMLFLGMECDGAPLTWTYGPLLTNSLSRAMDQSRTLSGSDCDKAWNIVSKLKCKEVYVYAMGMEPWLNHVMALSYTDDSIQITESNKFVKRCNENAIKAERLFGKKEWLL